MSEILREVGPGVTEILDVNAFFKAIVGPGYRAAIEADFQRGMRAIREQREADESDLPRCRMCGRFAKGSPHPLRFHCCCREGFLK